MTSETAIDQIISKETGKHLLIACGIITVSVGLMGLLDAIFGPPIGLAGLFVGFLLFEVWGRV